MVEVEMDDVGGGQPGNGGSGGSGIVMIAVPTWNE